MSEESMYDWGGKRIQILQNSNSGLYGIFFYSGTYRVCQMAGNFFTEDDARKGQKRLCRITGFKNTFKIRKVNK